MRSKLITSSITRLIIKVGLCSYNANHNNTKLSLQPVLKYICLPTCITRQFTFIPKSYTLSQYIINIIASNRRFYRRIAIQLVEKYKQKCKTSAFQGRVLQLIVGEDRSKLYYCFGPVWPH
jgi:hypothetical protein